MKLIHTADWHLGQRFHGQSRHNEHRHFLDWLLETLSERAPDALLIAGDVFDVINPTMAAQSLLYDFLIAAHERLPQLTIVMIAGNHDSGARIELPGPLLRRLNTHALGRILWHDSGDPDVDRLIVPLPDSSGAVRAWCLALPFLRPAEVTGRARDTASTESDNAPETPGDSYVRGMVRVHEALFDAGLQKREPGQALIAMSHAHLHGASVSEHSERPIVIGGEESLSTSLFPEEIAYVALGHLHKPQRVGSDHIRYSGSPLAMDFSETHYPHQVLEVTLEGAHVSQITPLPIPRAVAMHRVGPLPLDEVLEMLASDELPEDIPDALPREQWPWLDVRVILDAPRVDLRPLIEQALRGKAVRLVSITTSVARPDSPQTPHASLDALGPSELFSRTWKREYGDAPPDEVMHDVQSLLQALHDDESPEDTP
ncbi:Exodeoxyribonuclease I subunit D [Kushneria avicenniae]|uniref:Nuclease SbcCD subunit D n=1 Tax=Kushneria avicenniae TaxID=402385 RepID=A0A1I1GLI2_9GAMM|nr:exonuclease SbcCD subunit D C-terminal domain-containing protein [Kushneria avicenniae]SFC12315.1 Exodeoxyribonuclease I subunit D [Kushneria avicenniae]